MHANCDHPYQMLACGFGIEIGIWKHGLIGILAGNWRQGQTRHVNKQVKELGVAKLIKK